jgi:hypothetical protein
MHGWRGDSGATVGFENQGRNDTTPDSWFDHRACDSGLDRPVDGLHARIFFDHHLKGADNGYPDSTKARFDGISEIDVIRVK